MSGEPEYRHATSHPHEADTLKEMRLTALFFAALALCLGANELSNRRAPSFTLPDSNLKDYDVLDFRGKWLLIDFMKTECPHCSQLTKTLEPLKAKYAGKMQMIYVVIAPPENQDTVRKYINDHKVTSPVVFDQGQMTRTYFRLTPQKPSYDTPHLFVIDPNGNIVRDWSWEDKSKMLESGAIVKELDSLINGAKK